MKAFVEATSEGELSPWRSFSLGTIGQLRGRTAWGIDENQVEEASKAQAQESQAQVGAQVMWM